MSGRITIVDVARKAEVSISSVSSALNGGGEVSESTRKRILAAAKELGWVPSLRGRSLSGKRTFAVGLVVQRQPEVLSSDPFFAAFISGIEAVLEPRGQALVLQMATDAAASTERYRRLSAEHRVDGVFLDEIRVNDPRIALLQELGTPTVAVNSEESGSPFPSVRQSYRQGITEVVEHLVRLGHRRIAHVTGAMDFIHSHQRLDAWRAALAATGIEPGPVFEGDFTLSAGTAAADALLTPDRDVTAIVCANDLMAIGLMARAADLGVRVPRDVSVTGYDGNDMGTYLRPSLTTVMTSPSAIGRSAATMLLDAIDGNPVEDVAIDPARLVVRQSTAAPPTTA
ncbi:MAG TPA: LacI family DNA-binding transcriptional regulator [Galbitalea sp.]|jgi:DNA-binding LacI/PurR family transcriptional regulator